MLTTNETNIKNEIMKTLGVTPTENFDVKTAIRDRVDYLKSFLKSTGRKAIVLGISGGVDSTAAGSIAQMAIRELRDEGYDSKFIAMRLPYKTQKDEDEAQAAIKLINADEVVDVNIANGVDGVFDAVISGLEKSGLNKEEQDCSDDFAKGNVKARMRMISQYAIAGLYKGLVLGTDHNAENITGFYTHH
jgi:NAD+ synthase